MSITKNSNKKIATGLFVIMLALVFSSFTKNKSKAEVTSLNEISFMLSPGASPNLPSSWIDAELGDCEPKDNLCGISFNSDAYPLDPVTNKPNSAILAEVSNNWAATQHGDQTPNLDVTIYKRE